MKRFKCLFAAVLLLFCLACAGWVGAVAEDGASGAADTAPDVSLSPSAGVFSYAAEAGVLVRLISTSYDIRDDEGDPVQRVRFDLAGSGSELTMRVFNPSSNPQRFRVAFLTAEGRWESGYVQAASGANELGFSASAVDGFSGTLAAVEVLYSAFEYSGNSLIFGQMTYSGGDVAWAAENAGWQCIENPIVEAEAFFADEGTLLSRGVQAGVWYPVTFATQQDMSAYEGFSYYIDTSLGDRQVFFNKYVQERARPGETGFGEEWYLPDDGVAYYHPDGGIPFRGAANTVPAYFRGRVYCSFSAFRMPEWMTYPGNGVLDLDDTSGLIGLTFDGGLGDVRFILKDFRLETTVEEIEYEGLRQGDLRYLDDMSTYASTETVAFGWRTNWSLASPCAVTLIENEWTTSGAAGNALRIVPQTAPENPAPDPATGQTAPTNYTALEFFPVEGSADIAGSQGITFFLRNEESEPLLFGFEFDILQNGVRQRWGVKPRGRYILYDTLRGTQKLYNAPERSLYIPAGFTGWVRVDFGQFENPSWETVGGAFTTETGLAYFVINIDTLQYTGHSFVFDSLAVYTSDAGISTPFHTANTTLDQAIGGNGT